MYSIQDSVRLDRILNYLILIDQQFLCYVEFSVLLCTTLFCISSGTSIEVQFKLYNYVDHNHIFLNNVIAFVNNYKKKYENIMCTIFKFQSD